jgi:hypothetical protein
VALYTSQARFANENIPEGRVKPVVSLWREGLQRERGTSHGGNGGHCEGCWPFGGHRGLVEQRTPNVERRTMLLLFCSRKALLFRRQDTKLDK